MLPMIALRLSLGSQMAANAAFLAPATDPNEIALIKADFAEEENLVIGDLTLADFDGYAAIPGIVGAQQVGVDPVTGEQVVTVKEPAGGWRWATTGVTGLPMTIYGFALCTEAAAALLAVYRFPTPITLTASGQEINIGAATFRFVVQPVS